MLDKLLGQPIVARRLVADDGREIDLTCAEGKLELRGATVRPAVVFRDGRNVNHWGIAPEGWERTAESGAGTPIFYHHRLDDPGMKLGAVVSSKAGEDEQGRTFEQELSFAEGLGEALAEDQAELYFSIQVAPEEDTEFRCSACGEQWLAGDCLHLPGARYNAEGDPDPDGQPAKVILSHARLIETSATYDPAVDGTGFRAAVGDAVHRRALDWRAEAFERENAFGKLSAEQERLRADAEGQRLAAAEAQSRADELARELEMQAARQDMLRARSRLDGDPDQILQLRLAAGSELFGQFLALLPENPALQARVLSGAGTTPRVAFDAKRSNGEQPWTLRLAKAAAALAKTEGLSYEAAHSRLYPDFRPQGGRRR